MTMPLAGTLADGHVRTLFAPISTDPDSAAPREVLESWCRANNIVPTRLWAPGPIEIHALDPDELAHDRHEICWHETQAGDPGRTHLRTTPLLIEPAGILAGDLTCGHVQIECSTALGAPALLFVCDQHIDPRTGRHPGPHAGDWAGEHRLPPASGEARPRPEVTARRMSRMSWDNHHPGTIAFRDGLPYVGAMTPGAAHALVLARLDDMHQPRPQMNRARALISLDQHTRGLRELAERHAPRRQTTPAAGGPLCERRCAPWPCSDYRDGLSGIVTFPPAVTR